MRSVNYQLYFIFTLSLKIVFLVSFTLSTFACASTEYNAAEQAGAECVVLLHGLARSARAMNSLQQAFFEQGYAVLNINYPSTEFPIEILAEQHVHSEMKRLQSCPKVHFVTHSMGGIVLRYYLQQHNLANMGRVVMLSPPNQGSELVDKLGDIALFKWLNGPAGNQLSTAANSMPNQLGAVQFELAVVTGDRSFNPLYSWLIPGEDDGKVGVARARVNGMKTFKVVPKTHTFIMQSKSVIQIVMQFIKMGHLDLLPN